MKKILLLLFMIFMSINMPVIAQQLSGKHADIGLPCQACHGDLAPTKRAPASACMQCHGDYTKVAALTAQVTPNPHQSHQGELRCTLCHKSHEPSVLYCNECHAFDLQMK